MASSKNISCLPSDLLVLAFCKLEVQHIIRCTSVCKSWHHIINSPSFAKTHLTYQKASSNSKRYILHQDSKSCTLLTDIKPVLDCAKQFRIYFSPELFEDGVDISDACNLRIHGISDGLLCISDDGTGTYNPFRGYCVGDDLYLVNPICRRVKKLPELKDSKEDGIVTKGGVCFGYHDNDYKVIAVTCVDRKYVVSVYGLTSNCWNVIDTNCYYEHKIESRLDGFCVMQPTKFVDGIAYMIIDLCRRRPISNATPPLTVCFDLRDETIQEFKCPDEYFLGHNVEYTMEACGETIAVMVCDTYPGNLAMLILNRDKCSSKSPWEKKVVTKLKEARDHPNDIGLARSDPLPVGFIYNDNQYMVMTSFMYPNGVQTAFFLYDLESDEVTEYHSPQDYPDYCCKIDSACVENLLLLNEDCVDPFVDMEMELEMEMEYSNCGSMLFTLNYDLNKNGRKRKR